MEVILCSISADPLKLDKRPDYAAAAKVSLACQLNTPVNIENPEFILSISVATGYNYAYVPTWGKYYFLHESTILDGARCMIPGTCDVLTSNANEIKELNVRVKRYETNVTPDVMDNGITKTARTYTENRIFTGGYQFIIGEGSGLESYYHYVLSVVGGDGSQSGGGETNGTD